MWYAGCIDRGESMGLNKRRNAQSGFAFVEAVLATVILGSVMWGSLVMIANASVQSSTNDRTMIASQLAAQKLENILSDKIFEGYKDLSNAKYPDESLDGVYEGFNRSVDITEVSSDDLVTPQSGSGCKKISVKVYWGDSSEDQVTVEMLVGEYS